VYGCSIGPYLFNIFTVVTIGYICEENQHVQAVEKQIMLAILPADNLATELFPHQHFTETDGSDEVL
jgi:hypothetical protein